MLIIGNSHVSVFEPGLISPREPVAVRWVGALRARHFLDGHPAADAVRAAVAEEAGWSFVFVGNHDVHDLWEDARRIGEEESLRRRLSEAESMWRQLGPLGKVAWVRTVQQPAPGMHRDASATALEGRYWDGMQRACGALGIAMLDPLAGVRREDGTVASDLLQPDGLHLRPECARLFLEPFCRISGVPIEPAAPSGHRRFRTDHEVGSLCSLVASRLDLPERGMPEPEDLARRVAAEAERLVRGRGLRADIGVDSDLIGSGLLDSLGLVDLWSRAHDLLGRRVDFDVDLRLLPTPRQMAERLVRDLRPGPGVEDLVISLEDDPQSLANALPGEPGETAAESVVRAERRIASGGTALLARLVEIEAETLGAGHPYGILDDWKSLLEDDPCSAVRRVLAAGDPGRAHRVAPGRVARRLRSLLGGLPGPVDGDRVASLTRLHRHLSAWRLVACGAHAALLGPFLAPWLAAEPENLELLILGARCALAAGDIDASERFIARGDAVWPWSAEAPLLRSRILARRRQFQEALAALKEAMERDPHAIGIAEAAKELEEAVARVHATDGAVPASPPEAVSRAEELAGSGRLEEAEQMLLSVVRADPGRSDAFLVLARIFRLTGRSGRARQLLEGLERSVPGLPGLHDERRLLDEAGSADIGGSDAVAIADPPISFQNGSEEVVAKAQAAFDAGDFEGAGALLEKAASLAAGNAELLRAAGNMYLRAGIALKARQQFHRATQADPRSAPAMRDLAVSWQLLERPVEALKAAESAVRLDPTDGESAQVLGRILLARGEREAAISNYRRAIELGVEDGECLGIVGAWERDRGNFAGAVRNLRRACELLPEDASLRAELEAAERGLAQATRIGRGEGGRDILVSAIVSTYNSSRLLGACLEDLAGQTLGDRLEVIVVDSGSQEDEARIVESYRGRIANLRYLRTERESLYAAWNRGVRMARGRFVTNANTDDAHHPAALERLAEALERHPRAGFAYAWCEWTDVPNDTFGSGHAYRRIKFGPWNPAEGMIWCFFGQHPMWRRDLFDRVGLFDPSFAAAGDLEFQMRCIVAGEHGVVVPEVLGLFYQNPTGLTFQSERSAKEVDAINARYRALVPIQRLWRVDPAQQEDAARAWAAQGELALWFQAPWMDGPGWEPDYARQCFETALEIDPGCLAAQEGLGLVSSFRDLPPGGLGVAIANWKFGGGRPSRPMAAIPAPVDGVWPRPSIPALRWAAPMLNFTGYARLSRDTVETLDEMGAALSVEPLDIDGEFVGALKASAHRAARWGNMLSRPASPGAFVCSYIATDWTGRHDILGAHRRANPGHRRYAGVTMFETDRLPLGWAEACNGMDEIWVPSRFNAASFAASGVESSKIRVIPFGIRTRDFDPAVCHPYPFEGRRGFNFLSVFEWTDRKGWDVLLRAYFEAFDADDDVCLVLRTSLPKGSPGTVVDRIVAFARENGYDLDRIAAISVLERPVPDAEMPSLYAACDSFVLPTRGEGWGIPFLEAMCMGLPVIATRWSAHLDFLDDSNGYLIEVEDLVPIPRDKAPSPLYGPDHRWAEPSSRHTAELMRHVFEHRQEARCRGARARADVLAKWDSGRTARWILDRLEEVELGVPGASSTAPWSARGGNGGSAAAPVDKGRRSENQGVSPASSVPGVAQASKPAKNSDLRAPIVWRGGFFDFSGYSRLSRDIALSLDRAGARSHIEAFNADPRFIESLRKTPDVLARFDRLLAARPGGGLGVAAFPPTMWADMDVYTYFRGGHRDLDLCAALTMFETDGLPAGWAARCNGMDEIWVPSRFNVETFSRAGVSLEKLRVIPCGLDLTQFDPARVRPLPIAGRKGFAFLSVFQWTYRKGWDLLLRAWAQAFSRQDDVCLVLRAYPGEVKDPPIAERIRGFFASIGIDPDSVAPIVLLDGFVDEADMPALYASCDAFVLPTRGEGWGIPFLEAMAMGKPAIGTRWSAHLDFMNDGNSLLVDVEALEPVQAEQTRDSEFYTSDQRWARASVADLVSKLRALFENRDLGRRLGEAARSDVLRLGGVERTAEWVLERARSLESRSEPKAWVHGADLPRIGIDARTLYLRDSTDRGIGNYTYHHLRSILESRPGWRFTLIAPPDAPAPPAVVERLLEYPNVRLASLDSYRQEDFDLVHICDPLSMDPGFIPPASALPHARRSSVFYDLIPLRIYLESFDPAVRARYLERLRLNLESNIVLLAISEHTRTDVQCQAAISDRRVRTIGGGLNLAAAEGCSQEDSRARVDRLGIHGQFFLHVGSLDPHKNFEATLHAFLAVRERTPVQLVVVGRLAHSLKAWADVLRENRIQGVVFTDYLERADLEALYSRAAGLVTMSLYEGFGFPVLEAMAQGCPVLSSNRTSLPEVAGEAALLVDPDDRGAIADAMRSLLERPDLRDELRRRGRERAKLFSWSQVAARTLSNWEDMLATIPPHAPPRVGGTSRSHVLAPASGSGQHLDAGRLRTAPTPPATAPAALPALAPVLWHSPVFDPSGYADEARQFLLHLERIHAPVAARSIGRDSPTFRAQCDPAERAALERLLDAQPGREPISVVWFPAYAFQRLEGARYHVGRTTFETDGLPQAWVEACHRMDEIWVPSRFNVETFRRAGVRTRIEIVPEGVESARFRPGLEPLPLPAKRACTFLSIFEWTHRKGWDVLLRSWARAFGPGDDVQLVLRAYPPNVVEGDPAAWVEDRIDEFLADLGTSRSAIAPIVVLGRQVPAPEMPRLYAAADCYVAASRGEGWGRPHMEAMSSGLPVIATRWGGNLDFMDEGNSYLLALDGLEEIDVREEFEFYRGQKWASPSVDDLVRLLRHVRDHREEAAEIGRRARRDIEERWDWARIAPIAESRLREISGEIWAGGPRSSRPADTAPGKNAPASMGSSAGHAPGATTPTPVPVISVQGQTATTDAIAPARGMLSVRWEGSQFVHHSLAHVNRELCLGLARAGHDMSIIAYEPDQFGPGEDPDLGILAQLTGAPLDAACQVHVRHQWPPNLTPPSEGRWVVIQPWEFGSPPRDWMPAFRDQVDEIWAYTTHVRDLYLRAGVPADRVHVVPLGVDAAKFRPGLDPLPGLPARSGVRFLYVGGTIGRKGFDLLLRAWEKAFGPTDSVELLIKDMGGKTSYQGQTSQDAVRRLQESGRCAHILYRDDDLAPSALPQLYAAGDVLVHPYRGEGFGLPVAEAMACGLPVIVTDGGAADDFCGPESGWKIPARIVPVPGGRVGPFETVEPPTWLDPDLDALVAALREAAARPDLRRLRGQAARSRIEAGFTWKHAVGKAEERLRVVAARPPRRAAPPLVPDRALAATAPSTNMHRVEADEKLASLLVQVEASAGRGELGAAEALTHEAVATAPHSPLAWVAHSMILRATGKFAQAVMAIRQGLEREESPTVLLEAVEAYHAAGDRGNALRLAGRLRERHPDWVHAQRASYKAAGKPWTPDLVKSGKASSRAAAKGGARAKRR